MKAITDTRAVCPHCGHALQLESLGAGLVRVTDKGATEIINVWKDDDYELVIITLENGIVEDVDIQLRPLSEWTLRQRSRRHGSKMQPDRAEQDAEMVRSRETYHPLPNRIRTSGNIF